MLNFVPHGVIDQGRPPLWRSIDHVTIAGPFLPPNIDRHAEQFSHRAVAKAATTTCRIWQGCHPPHRATNGRTVRDQLEGAAHVRRRLRIGFEDRSWSSLASFVVGGRSPEIPPRAGTYRPPAVRRDVATDRRHALPELTDLLLSDAREDVGDKVRHFSAFAHRVDGNAEVLQLFATANPLQQLTSESVQLRYHHDHWCALLAPAAHMGQQGLILRPVVARTRQDILVFVTDNPPMLRGMPSAVGKLCVEAEPFARLLVARDARVDQGGRDAGLLLRYLFHADPLSRFRTAFPEIDSGDGGTSHRCKIDSASTPVLPSPCFKPLARVVLVGPRPIPMTDEKRGHTAIFHEDDR